MQDGPSVHRYGWRSPDEWPITVMSWSRVPLTDVDGRVHLFDVPTAILAAPAAPLDVELLAWAIEATLLCEDPEEACDADGRDDHRWCDYCIARGVAGTHIAAIAREYARLSDIGDAAAPAPSDEP
jgi:hypothetical protein